MDISFVWFLSVCFAIIGEKSHVDKMKESATVVLAQTHKLSHFGLSKSSPLMCRFFNLAAKPGRTQHEWASSHSWQILCRNSCDVFGSAKATSEKGNSSILSPTRRCNHEIVSKTIRLKVLTSWGASCSQSGMDAYPDLSTICKRVLGPVEKSKDAKYCSAASNGEDDGFASWKRMGLANGLPHDAHDPRNVNVMNLIASSTNARKSKCLTHQTWGSKLYQTLDSRL